MKKATDETTFKYAGTNFRAGIALVELVTALFVLTAGLFGAMQMYHFCLSKTRALNESALALHTLANELETVRALPFAELKNGEALPFRSRTPALEELVNAEGTVRIEDYAPGLKQVTVRIRWTGEHGRTVAKQLVTLIADKGGR